MGTRHLIAVANNGDYPIAQYGQWDGYPSGNGLEVLRFARKRLATVEGRAAFQRQLIYCRYITDQQCEEMMRAEGVKVMDGGYISMADAKKFDAKFPSLSRDTSAGVLDIVAEAVVSVPLQKALNFAQDSLFCEWAYVLDLDAGVFEVYKGFNKLPVAESERFATENEDHFDIETAPARDSEYFPVKFAHKWSLDTLPEDEHFLAVLKEEEED